MMTHKILILGEGGVGKSSFVSRFNGEAFDANYIPTLGVNVNPIRVRAFCANMWDCAGQYRFRGLREGYFVNANAAIFIFDLTSPVTLLALPKWIEICKGMCGNIPCVVVGTKCDAANKMSPEEVLRIIGPTYPYVEVSSKDNINIQEPCRLIEQLLG